jgi:pyruvate/2-oxoacid:ferredoxin oxidoreductase alpha subunit
MIVIDTGDRIAAKAAQMARPEFIAAYPITPQTVIVEKTAEYTETGELDAEYMRVESEHSAMTAVIGAAITGVRTFTATSSHGLALMHEMLHWAALSRLPIVMVNVNRALGPGWNIWADQTDALAQRDTGWIQVYCSSCQEIFDLIIQAYRLAEMEDVQLPVMVNYDAFVLSHTSMPVEIPEQSAVDGFLPPYKPLWTVDPDDPVTYANMVPPADYGELRKDMHDAHIRVLTHFPHICAEWKQRFGTWHGDLVEMVDCDDAEYVLVCMGAFGSEAKVAVRQLREEGIKAGLVRIRLFRPFPREQLRAVARGRTLVVIDRNVSVGSGGGVYGELKSALYGHASVPVHGFIAGLGGKDVTYSEMTSMVRMVMDGRAGEIEWWGFNGREAK